MNVYSVSPASASTQLPSREPALPFRHMTILEVMDCLSVCDHSSFSFYISHEAITDLRRDEICEGESAEEYLLRAENHERHC